MADDGDAAMSEATVVGWILAPIFLGVLLYMGLALMVWPYARPRLPFALLLLAILVPPLFPFLLVYLLVAVLCLPPVVLLPPPALAAAPPPPLAVRTATIVVVEPDARGRVRAASPRRGAAASPRRGAGAARSSSSV